MTSAGYQPPCRKVAPSVHVFPSWWGISVVHSASWAETTAIHSGHIWTGTGRTARDSYPLALDHLAVNIRKENPAADLLHNRCKSLERKFPDRHVF